MISYCTGGVGEHWGTALEAPTCLFLNQNMYIILMIFIEYNSVSHWFSGQSDCLSGCRPGFESLQHQRVFCNFFHALISKKKLKKWHTPMISYTVMSYWDIICPVHKSRSSRHMISFIWYHMWYHALISYVISYYVISYMKSYSMTSYYVIVYDIICAIIEWYSIWCHRWYHIPCAGTGLKNPESNLWLLNENSLSCITYDITHDITCRHHSMIS